MEELLAFTSAVLNSTGADSETLSSYKEKHNETAPAAPQANSNAANVATVLNVNLFSEIGRNHLHHVLARKIFFFLNACA